jgi:hypothetical protein
MDINAPWEEKREPKGETSGRRLQLWFRADRDADLSAAINHIADGKGVGRSAVARWLCSLGLDAARERGLV